MEMDMEPELFSGQGKHAKNNLFVSNHNFTAGKQKKIKKWMRIK